MSFSKLAHLNTSTIDTWISILPPSFLLLTADPSVSLCAFTCEFACMSVYIECACVCECTCVHMCDDFVMCIYGCVHIQL